MLFKKFRNGAVVKFKNNPLSKLRVLSTFRLDNYNKSEVVVVRNLKEDVPLGVCYAHDLELFDQKLFDIYTKIAEVQNGAVDQIQALNTFIGNALEHGVTKQVCVAGDDLCKGDVVFKTGSAKKKRKTRSDKGKRRK